MEIADLLLVISMKDCWSAAR